MLNCWNLQKFILIHQQRNKINSFNLSFEVKQGEVFGLLGANGAGKTTFLSILGGTVIKTSGQVNVWGFDLDKNTASRASLGIVPQSDRILF